MPNQVKMEVSASALRAGDLIVYTVINGDVIGHTVVSCTFTRARWAVVVTGGDGNLVRRFREDEKFTILRSVPTDKERADKEQEVETWVLRNLIDNMIEPEHVKYLRKAIVNFDNGGDGHLSYSDLSDLIDAQARYRLGTFLHSEADRFMKAGATEIQALRAAFAYVMRESLREMPRSPLSRSTSVISNLLDDVNTYVIDSTLQTVKRRVKFSQEDYLAAADECHALFAA